MRNRQVGPSESAAILADVVKQVSYKPGWSFALQEMSRGQGSQGLTLRISGPVEDSCNPGEQTYFDHSMPVLPAAYNRKAWIGWVLEQIRMVEWHETMEWFRVNGVQVCFPSHAPGDNPYAHYWVRDGDEAFAEALPWDGGQLTDPFLTGKTDEFDE